MPAGTTLALSQPSRMLWLKSLLGFLRVITIMPVMPGRSSHQLFSRIGLPSYLNISRRLLRWMKQIHLPRTNLRMRYVRLVHAFHVLDGSCSHVNLINAMETLIAGWVAVDEGDRLSEYSIRLRAQCQELQEAIVRIL
jgi:hypothetical protein